VECEKKTDTNNNGRSWNHLRTTKKKYQQHKSLNQKQKKNKENSHIEHGTHTVKCTDIEVRNI
jgi:hypothetical protein